MNQEGEEHAKEFIQSIVEAFALRLREYVQTRSTIGTSKSTFVLDAIRSTGAQKIVS